MEVFTAVLYLIIVELCVLTVCILCVNIGSSGVVQDGDIEMAPVGVHRIDNEVQGLRDPSGKKASDAYAYDKPSPYPVFVGIKSRRTLDAESSAVGELGEESYCQSSVSELPTGNVSVLREMYDSGAVGSRFGGLDAAHASGSVELECRSDGTSSSSHNLPKPVLKREALV